MGNALSGSGVSQACCARATVGGASPTSAAEAEPSGPLEIVDVVLVLNLGGLGKWAKSSALLSCGVAFGTVL